MEVKKKAKDPLRHRNSVRQQLVEAQVMVSEKERMKNMSDFMLSSELDNLMEVSVPPPPPPRDDDDEDSDDMLSDGVGVPAEPRDVAEDSDDMLSEGLGDVMVGGVDDDDDDDDEMELSDDLGVAHTHPTTSRATMPRVFSNGRIDALARDDSHKVKNLVSNNQKLKRMHRALNPAQKRQLGLRDNSVPLDGRTKKAKTLKAKGRAGQIIVDENTRRLHRTGGGSSASSGGTIRLIARPKKRGKEPGDLPNQDVIDRGRREAAALRKTNMVEVRFAPPGNLMSNGLDNIPLEARKAMEDGVGESGDQKRLERQIRRLDYINNNKNQSRGKLEATTALEKERREEIDEVDKMRSQFQHTGHYNIMREILTRPAHEDINNASIENGGVPDLVVDLIERSFQRVELNTRRREEERDMREWRTATLDGHKCVNGSECEIRRLALPAGKEETAVGLMYMTADQWAAFDMSRGKELPDVPGPCLLCLRASMQIIYFAMESSHLSAASDYLEQRVCNYVNKPGEYMFQYTLTNPEKGIPHPIVLHCYDYYECELDQDGYVRIYQTGLPSIDIEEVLDAMPLDESFVDPSGITETRSMAENEPHTLSSDEHVRRADVANRKTMRERHEKDWKQKRDLLKKRLVNKLVGKKRKRTGEPIETDAPERHAVDGSKLDRFRHEHLRWLASSVSSTSEKKKAKNERQNRRDGFLRRQDRFYEIVMDNVHTAAETGKGVSSTKWRQAVKELEKLQRQLESYRSTWRSVASQLQDSRSWEQIVRLATGGTAMLSESLVAFARIEFAKHDLSWDHAIGQWPTLWDRLVELRGSLTARQPTGFLRQDAVGPMTARQMKLVRTFGDHESETFDYVRTVEDEIRHLVHMIRSEHRMASTTKPDETVALTLVSDSILPSDTPHEYHVFDKQAREWVEYYNGSTGDADRIRNGYLRRKWKKDFMESHKAVPYPGDAVLQEYLDRKMRELNGTSGRGGGGGGGGAVSDAVLMKTMRALWSQEWRTMNLHAGQPVPSRDQDPIYWDALELYLEARQDETDWEKLKQERGADAHRPKDYKYRKRLRERLTSGTRELVDEMTAYAWKEVWEPDFHGSFNKMRYHKGVRQRFFYQLKEIRTHGSWHESRRYPPPLDRISSFFDRVSSTSLSFQSFVPRWLVEPFFSSQLDWFLCGNDPSQYFWMPRALVDAYYYGCCDPEPLAPSGKHPIQLSILYTLVSRVHYFLDYCAMEEIPAPIRDAFQQLLDAHFALILTIEASPSIVTNQALGFNPERYQTEGGKTMLDPTGAGIVFQPDLSFVFHCGELPDLTTLLPYSGFFGTLLKTSTPNKNTKVPHLNAVWHKLAEFLLKCGPFPCKKRKKSEQYPFFSGSMMKEPVVFQVIIRIVFGASLGVYPDSDFKSQFHYRKWLYRIFSVHPLLDLEQWINRRPEMVISSVREYMFWAVSKLPGLHKALSDVYYWPTLRKIVSDANSRWRCIMTEVCRPEFDLVAMVQRFKHFRPLRVVDNWSPQGSSDDEDTGDTDTPSVSGTPGPTLKDTPFGRARSNREFTEKNLYDRDEEVLFGKMFELDYRLSIMSVTGANGRSVNERPILKGLHRYIVLSMREASDFLEARPAAAAAAKPSKPRKRKKAHNVLPWKRANFVHDWIERQGSPTWQQICNENPHRLQFAHPSLVDAIRHVWSETVARDALATDPVVARKLQYNWDLFSVELFHVVARKHVKTLAEKMIEYHYQEGVVNEFCATFDRVVQRAAANYDYMDLGQTVAFPTLATECMAAIRDFVCTVIGGEWKVFQDWHYASRPENMRTNHKRSVRNAFKRKATATIRRPFKVTDVDATRSRHLTDTGKNHIANPLLSLVAWVGYADDVMHHVLDPAKFEDETAVQQALTPILFSRLEQLVNYMYPAPPPVSRHVPVQHRDWGTRVHFHRLVGELAVEDFLYRMNEKRNVPLSWRPQTAPFHEFCLTWSNKVISSLSKGKFEIMKAAYDDAFLKNRMYDPLLPRLFLSDKRLEKLLFIDYRTYKRIVNTVAYQTSMLTKRNDSLFFFDTFDNEQQVRAAAAKGATKRGDGTAADKGRVLFPVSERSKNLVRLLVAQVDLTRPLRLAWLLLCGVSMLSIVWLHHAKELLEEEAQPAEIKNTLMRIAVSEPRDFGILLEFFRAMELRSQIAVHPLSAECAAMQVEALRFRLRLQPHQALPPYAGVVYVDPVDASYKAFVSLSAEDKKKTGHATNVYMSGDPQMQLDPLYNRRYNEVVNKKGSDINGGNLTLAHLSPNKKKRAEKDALLDRLGYLDDDDSDSSDDEGDDEGDAMDSDDSYADTAHAGGDNDTSVFGHLLDFLPTVAGFHDDDDSAEGHRLFALMKRERTKRRSNDKGRMSRRAMVMRHLVPYLEANLPTPIDPLKNTALQLPKPSEERQLVPYNLVGKVLVLKIKRPGKRTRTVRLVLCASCGALTEFSVARMYGAMVVCCVQEGEIKDRPTRPFVWSDKGALHPLPVMETPVAKRILCRARETVHCFFCGYAFHNNFATSSRKWMAIKVFNDCNPDTPDEERPFNDGLDNSRRTVQQAWVCPKHTARNKWLSTLTRVYSKSQLRRAMNFPMYLRSVSGTMALVDQREEAESVEAREKKKTHAILKKHGVSLSSIVKK